MIEKIGISLFEIKFLYKPYDNSTKFDKRYQRILYDDFNGFVKDNKCY